MNLVKPKPFWTDQNCFGHIEGQGISDTYILCIFDLIRQKQKASKKASKKASNLASNLATFKSLDLDIIHNTCYDVCVVRVM